MEEGGEKKSVQECLIKDDVECFWRILVRDPRGVVEQLKKRCFSHQSLLMWCLDHGAERCFKACLFSEDHIPGSALILHPHVNLHLQDTWQRTVLEKAVQVRHGRIVEHIMTYVTNLLVADDLKPSTDLMLALIEKVVEMGEVDLATLLMQDCRIDLEILTTWPGTVLELACREQLPFLTEFLLSSQLLRGKASLLRFDLLKKLQLEHHSKRSGQILSLLRVYEKLLFSSPSGGQDEDLREEDARDRQNLLWPHLYFLVFELERMGYLFFSMENLERWTLRHRWSRLTGPCRQRVANALGGSPSDQRIETPPTPQLVEIKDYFTNFAKQNSFL